MVGVDSAAQLEEIVEAAKGPVYVAPDDFASDDLDLINPSQWEIDG